MKARIRKYHCIYNTGNSFGEFDFFSEHRAGSMANKDDARNHMQHCWGNHSRNWKIVKSFLIESY